MQVKASVFRFFEKILIQCLIKSCIFPGEHCHDTVPGFDEGGFGLTPAKGGSPKVFPLKIFNVRASEMAQIRLVFIAVFAYKDKKKYPFQKIYLLAEMVTFFKSFYVQFRGFDRNTRTTPRSAPATVCLYSKSVLSCRKII